MELEFKILSKDGSAKGTRKMPSQFTETVRPDVISRAVLVVQANIRQSYGANFDAGLRHSVEISRRRKNYRGSYGHGISRVPRKIHTRRGTRMFWVGARAPGTVGGREAHPPKPAKDLSLKINKKENRLAIRSAIAATVVADMVKEHGYQIPQSFPFIISDDLEQLSKTKDVRQALEALGFSSELERATVKSVRAGRGKMRSRPYKKKTSLLFVVSKKCPLMDAAKNLPGVEISVVDSLNAELLAPGAKPGRLTLYSSAAVARLEKEGLFTDSFKGKSEKKTENKSETKVKRVMLVQR